MSGNSRPQIAEVLLELNLDKPLDYLIPSDMEGKVQSGSRVEIPLRGGTSLGFVARIKQETDFKTLKSILRHAEASSVEPDLFELALWMSRYYVTPLKKVLKSFLPAAVRKEKEAKQQYVIQKKATQETLAEAARELRQKGSPQAELIDYLLKAPKSPFLSEAMEKTGVLRASVDSLVKKGLVELVKIAVNRSPLEGAEYFKTLPKTLNSAQKKALDAIHDSLDHSRFQVHLLWGITGSGKTEVYLQAIQRALDQGKGAILLVPEIALTEQTIERFRSRFDGPIAILHHRLSDGERLDEWQRIQKGEAKIVIGARSSLFAPVKNLGLILLDEEHEGSYKQSDEAPRYHAREVAIMRGKITGAPVILGSATPSLESFHNAMTGKFQLLELGERATAQSLPSIEIIDMKREYEKQGGYTLFSAPLLSAIKERVQAGEQTLLFLNRRGYHACMKCQGCGEAVKCRHCDVSLTFHKGDHQLACHLCGFHIAPPSVCPECKTGSPLKFKGVGTEQAEAALHAIFPEIRTLRMDADTTKHKGSHNRLFKDFGRGKADVLIGTQMIAKGLHFPEVTLVGVLSCDTALNIPDFRASEYTFQLLTQVAGRAGRGVKKGHVILQTHMPENNTILLAAKQDYLAFYKEEITIRELFSYPPFTALIKIGITSPHEKQAFETLESLRKALPARLPAACEILPTLPAGHARVKDLYRFHFLIKTPSPLPTIKILNDLLSARPHKPELKLSIDVGPTSTFF